METEEHSSADEAEGEEDEALDDTTTTMIVQSNNLLPGFLKQDHVSLFCNYSIMI